MQPTLRGSVSAWSTVAGFRPKSQQIPTPQVCLSESSRRAANAILPLAHDLMDEELLEQLGGYRLQLERNSLRQWPASDDSAEEVIRRLIVHHQPQRELPEQERISAGPGPRKWHWATW